MNADELKIPLYKTMLLKITSLIVAAILVTSLFGFVYKALNFNRPLPDVSEIPREVKRDILRIKPTKQFYVPILLYHYVEYVKDPGDTIRKSLNIVPIVFDEEVKTLKDAGFVFITPKDIADIYDDRMELPNKPVILTFDDGYRDFYIDVFPILKKYNVKAIAYIVPNFLDKPNNLTSWQLKEIAQSGLVEIGAHTMDHTYLAGLPLKKVKSEIEESKKYLEEKLGIQIVSFAYPYGAFDNQSIQVVKDAGFKTAVTTISGTLITDTNRYFLYRIRPGGRVGKNLLSLINEKTFPQDKLTTPIMGVSKNNPE